MARLFTLISEETIMRMASAAEAAAEARKIADAECEARQRACEVRQSDDCRYQAWLKDHAPAPVLKVKAPKAEAPAAWRGPVSKPVSVDRLNSKLEMNLQLFAAPRSEKTSKTNSFINAGGIGRLYNMVNSADKIHITDFTDYKSGLSNNGGCYSFTQTFSRIDDETFDVLYSTSADFQYCQFTGNFCTDNCDRCNEAPEKISWREVMGRVAAMECCLGDTNVNIAVESRKFEINEDFYWIMTSKYTHEQHGEKLRYVGEIGQEVLNGRYLEGCNCHPERFPNHTYVVSRGELFEAFPNEEYYSNFGYEEMDL